MYARVCVCMYAVYVYGMCACVCMYAYMHMCMHVYIHVSVTAFQCVFLGGIFLFHGDSAFLDKFLTGACAAYGHVFQMFVDRHTISACICICIRVFVQSMHTCMSYGWHVCVFATNTHTHDTRALCSCID
jgi:hypothetical protein